MLLQAVRVISYTQLKISSDRNKGSCTIRDDEIAIGNSGALAGTLRPHGLRRSRRVGAVSMEYLNGGRTQDTRRPVQHEREEVE